MKSTDKYMKKKPKFLKEVFTIDPTQGAAAALCGLSKPGYKMVSLVRKGGRCTVTYESH